MEEDLAWAKAWLAWQAGLCRGCMRPIEETTARADGDPVHTYTVPHPRRCAACDELAIAQDEAEDKGVARPQALHWSIVEE